MNKGSLLKGKTSKESLVSLILPASFLITLGFFSWTLYRDNYFTMYDLGVAYRSSYLFLVLHNLVTYPYHFFVAGTLNQKFLYIPLSLTLLINNSPTTILIDQTISIAIGGYAIFHISRYFGLNVRLSILNQAIYFLYPAIYGYLTHGGNFQVYFLGIFLCAYLFYLKDKKLMFGIFAILAAVSNVLSPIYVLGFFSWILVLKITQRYYSKRATSRKEKSLLESDIYFVIIPFIILAILMSVEIYQNGHYLLLGNLQGRYVSPVSSVNTNKGLAGLLDLIIESLGLNLKMKVSFFIDMLLPFLFTALLSFSFPFIFIYFLSISYLNYPGFFSILQQYPYAVIPFIFIGWISFQSKITGQGQKDKNTLVSNNKIHKFIWYIKKRQKTVAYIITFLVLMSSTISFLTFSPFSIQNIESGQLKEEISYTPLEMELNHMYSLVPRSSIVFIQNDVPELSDAKKIYMPGFGTYQNQTVDYAVFNPLEYNSITTPFNGFSEKWAYYFSTNSSYGVYASVDGAILYKLHYNAQPVYFVPIKTTTTHGFTLGLVPNVTVPSVSLANIWSSQATFNTAFYVNTSEPLSQNSLRLLVESSDHSLSITKTLNIYGNGNNKDSYILKGNITIPYYDDWSFYIIGNENAYNNVTLGSGNIKQMSLL